MIRKVKVLGITVLEVETVDELDDETPERAGVIEHYPMGRVGFAEVADDGAMPHRREVWE